MTQKTLRGVCPLLAALLLCAAPAAAQRTLAVPAAGVSRAIVPVAAVAGGQVLSPVSLPFLLSPLPLTASPSALPDPTPSVSPEVIPFLAPHAPILAASQQTAGLPTAPSAPDVPALGETSAQSRPQPPAAQSAAPEEISGDELFDGSARIPTVAVALARRAEGGVSIEEVARAIAGSRGLPEASGRLAGLGLLKLSEVRSQHPNTLTHLETLIEGLWRETSPSLGLENGVDRHWAVPALVVRRGRTTFYIHPIAHGQIRPDNRGPVLRLTREIKASGGLLYSEQNLPGVYGYQDGREFLDHDIANGKPVAVKDAGAGPLWMVQRLDRLLNSLIPLGAIAWSSFSVWTTPSHLGSWILFGAALALTWLWARAFKPLWRWRRLVRASQLQALGDVDGAAWYEADAAAFYGRLIDPAVLRRLRLPLPLGLGSDRYSKRSLGMADVLPTDAAARGAEQVHVLTGYEHSLDIAWRLQNPKESKT